MTTTTTTKLDNNREGGGVRFGVGSAKGKLMAVRLKMSTGLQPNVECQQMDTVPPSSGVPSICYYRALSEPVWVVGPSVHPSIHLGAFSCKHSHGTFLPLS